MPILTLLVLEQRLNRLPSLAQVAWLRNLVGMLQHERA